MIADDKPASFFLFPKQREVAPGITNLWPGEVPFTNDVGRVFARKFKLQNRKRQRAHACPVRVALFVVGQRSIVPIGDAALAHKRERVGGPIAIHEGIDPSGIPVVGLALQGGQNGLAVSSSLSQGSSRTGQSKHRQNDQEGKGFHFFDELCGMNWIRNFYREYKPYIFSDGWYYVFILVFIALLFLFFA